MYNPVKKMSFYERGDRRLSDNRHSGLDPESIGISRCLKHWIPAFAGMTNTTI